MRSKQNDPPHTPDFSTTRSFPGVGRVEASPETALPRFLKLRAPEEGTPPMTPSTAGIWPPLISAGKANIVTSAERKSISSEEKWTHQVYVL
jgi:hypothetical protein